MGRDGQLFSSDFIISAFIFIVLLNVAMIAWQIAYERQARFSEQEVMRQDAFQLANLLVRTPGYPADWNRSTVALLGLASPDHTIQPDKVQEMQAIPYEDLVGIADVDPNDLFINITGSNYSATVGESPSTPETVVVERRSVLINATPLQRGTMEVVVWN